MNSRGPQSPSRERRIALACAVVGLAGMVAGGFSMSRRIADFHDEHKRAFFYFKEIDQREFQFAGRKVTLTDVEEGPKESPVPYLVVNYGDEQLKLPVSIPIKFKLPGLASHNDWMRVLRFGDGAGLTATEFDVQVDTGKIKDRLVIVTRSLRPGSDPGSWGEVWKKDWTFDFYEFMPPDAAGKVAFSHEHLRYPTAREGQEDKPGELHENTWQFQAALYTMPRQGPTQRFRNNAFSALGWVLPATGFAGILMIGGIAFAIAPRKRAATTRTPT